MSIFWPVGNNDKRTVMQLGGIPTLKLIHATLKSQTLVAIGTKLTVGAYRNGMGSIYFKNLHGLLSFYIQFLNPFEIKYCVAQY